MHNSSSVATTPSHSQPLIGDRHAVNVACSLASAGTEQVRLSIVETAGSIMNHALNLEGTWRDCRHTLSQWTSA